MPCEMLRRSCTLRQISRRIEQPVPWCWSGRRSFRLGQGRQALHRGLAGLWCTGLGYGNEELIEAAREQMSRLSFTPPLRRTQSRAGDRTGRKTEGAGAAPTSRSFSPGARRRTTLRSSSPGTTTRPWPDEEEEDHQPNEGLPRSNDRSGSLTGLPVFHADFDPMQRVLHTDCHDTGGMRRKAKGEEEYATRLANNLED